MKFRMIFLGAEQDPDGGTVPELDADIPVDESSLRCYEYSGTHMVRRDQLANGRVRRTPVANFRARIVSDIIRDDGALTCNIRDTCVTINQTRGEYDQSAGPAMGFK